MVNNSCSDEVLQIFVVVKNGAEFWHIGRRYHWHFSDQQSVYLIDWQVRHRA